MSLPIRVDWIRFNGSHPDTYTSVSVRHFKSFSNAVKRSSELALLQGYPLDKFDISNAESSLPLGTLTVHVGRIELVHSQSYRILSDVIDTYAKK